MTIHFHIRFSTTVGQSLFISGNIEELGSDDLTSAVPLRYLNNDFWHGSIVIDDLPDTDTINYRYVLREGDIEIIDGEAERFFKPGIASSETIYLFDTWNHAGDALNCFYTQPFKNVLLARVINKPKTGTTGTYTHEFKVKAPLLKSGETICLLGSGKQLQEWKTVQPLVLQTTDGWYAIRINLIPKDFPLEYKYGIFNTIDQAFLGFEAGENRILNQVTDEKSTIILHDGFVQMAAPTWRGAGIAIPVFSLRSKNGFGVGEFTDIKLLVDWAKLIGLKMVQILPVNDTTSKHSWLDSYPYSAISAFALHPVYLNLEAVAGVKDKRIIQSLRKKQKGLNASRVVDYEQVMKFKLAALRDIFENQKEAFLNDPSYFEFFDLNRNWLVPYAAFCFLRDKYKTADFPQWKTNAVFNEDAIQKLVSPAQKHYNQVLFHYFIQYHLHLQLLSASDYAHKKGVILKGDIPIGISRYSVDAWVDPGFYNMDQQAGAPPDDFAIKGQNWGFPTYNWKHMQENGYSWWRHRFEQMSNYFDAFRIDHILGFFRIWSIPTEHIEGIMGNFVPAIPIHISEFHSNGIWFDYARYCNPYITEDILTGLFGDQVDFIKLNFLEESGVNNYKFKEGFNTQRKIEDQIAEMADDGTYLKEGLFSLLSNIILIEEKESQAQQFHFRISMQNTSSFHNLDQHTQSQLQELYINYFFRRQNEFWKKEGIKKLPGLKRSTNMLICGEDLGMVPECVPEVMKQLAILSLEIQRMPKDPSTAFFHPRNAPYLAVVTPSTHDMSTIREWWEEDKEKTQQFYNSIMSRYGVAPYFCEPWVSRDIVIQHLYSPAMWSVFQFQDLIGMSSTLRRENPYEERINQPSDPKHYWQYRMHIPLETMIKENEFNTELKTLVEKSGR